MAKKYIDADTLWNRLISVSENDWVGFDTIDEVLSGMPAEQRWIPVTERLPAYGEEVLLSLDGDCGIGYLVPTYDERRYEWNHLSHLWCKNGRGGEQEKRQ